MQRNGLNRFLLVRDEFYSDPEGVRRTALSMAFEPVDGITGSAQTCPVKVGPRLSDLALFSRPWKICIVSSQFSCQFSWSRTPPETSPMASTTRLEMTSP